MVQRYDIDVEGYSMECDCGEFVTYEDYERLQNELADKTAAIDALLKETQAFVATCNKMGIKHWGK